MIKLLIDDKLNEIDKTWYWLEKETGIGHSVGFNLRNNKVQTINLDYLSRICKLLECQPGDIMIYVEERPESKKKSKAKG
jgi:putative transcriptional regulator